MAEYDVFAEIVRKYGEPSFPRRLSPPEVARYSGRLPDALLAFWRDHGLGNYQQGRFTFTYPADFEAVVARIFGGDAEFKPKDILAIGYGAFGRFSCWHASGNALYVDFDDQEVLLAKPDPDAPTRPELAGLSLKPGSVDFGIGIAVEIEIETDDVGPFDVGDDTDLSVTAPARLGALVPGEMYGFVPALNFGGSAQLANVRKVDAVSHLLFLAQVSHFKLMKVAPATPTQPFGHRVVVRDIGP